MPLIGNIIAIEISQNILKYSQGWVVFVRSVVLEIIFGLLVFILCLLSMVGCMYKGEQMETTEASNVGAKVQFDLPSGLVELYVKDLERIKNTLVSYFQVPGKDFQPYLEFQESLLEEAKKLPVWIDNDVAHVGRWVLQLRNNEFVLVRSPQRAEVMYIFVATLTAQDSGWEISKFVHERQISR